MKLEVLEFYPKEKTDDGFISGEIKIRLPDLKMNILGILFTRRTNGRWWVQMPFRSVIDTEGTRVRFPVVGFDKEEHEALMATLYEAIPTFVEQRLNDTTNPIVFPKANQNRINAPSGAPNQPSRAKVVTATQKAVSAPKKTAMREFREFVDLPPKTKTRTYAKTK